MEVAEIDGFEARCTARGIGRRVNLFLLQDEPLAPGDHVLVHIGYAIQKLEAEDAKERWAVLDQMISAMPELTDDETRALAGRPPGPRRPEE